MSLVISHFSPEDDRTGSSRKDVQMLRVLIAEDDQMTADLLAELLTARGYEVCGAAHTVDEAVALGDLHKPDLAVLDVRLAMGERGAEIARRLKSRGKFGILYVTSRGAHTSGLARADGEAPITKPYRSADILRALAIVREIATGCAPTPPFPRGFRLLSEPIARLKRDEDQQN
jgi:DNA-binding response OmpR family regulator